jgi:hypothetical protein
MNKKSFLRLVKKQLLNKVKNAASEHRFAFAQILLLVLASLLLASLCCYFTGIL